MWNLTSLEEEKGENVVKIKGKEGAVSLSRLLKLLLSACKLTFINANKAQGPGQYLI